MRVLKEAQTLVLRLLDGKEAKSGRLRPSRFSLEETVPGGRLLYHTLTKELLFLEEGEEQTDYLRRRFFLAEEAADERVPLRELREALRFIGQTRFRGYKRYTILPTTDCNARCFYCYEAGCEKLNMDAQTADRTAAFILQTCAQEELSLRFFGGEPLMGAEALDRICAALKEAGRSFHSNIVSNGYLFDAARVEKARSLWNLKQAQITLDGTEAVYNERKDFIHDKDGAFRRVTDNMEGLLENGMSVAVRLNMDEVNYEDLRTLAGQLAARFGRYEKFSVYPYLLFQDILSPSAGRRAALFALYRRFRAQLGELGLLPENELPGKLRTYSCMADDPASVVILPDGRLHACEHFTEGRCFGTLEEAPSKAAEAAYWQESFPEDPACESCPLYPDCFRPLHCPDRADFCIAEQREAEIEKLRLGMRAAYERAVSGGQA